MSDSTNDMWDDDKWVGYGHFAGVVFVVLGLVANFAPGQPPSRDAAAAEITEYFVDNSGGIKLSAVLFGISLIFGLWWLGSLWRVISKLEPGGPRLAFIAAAGFVMAGTAATVGQAVFTVPATRESLVEASEVFFELGFVTYLLSIGFLVAHLLALAVLVMWQKFLPAWMAWLALLGAVAGVLGLVATASTSSPLTNSGFLCFLVWQLWILVAAIVLGRRSLAG